MKSIFETPKTAEKIQGTSNGKATILLADDDLAIRKILHRLLVDEGYCVLTAANGIEAIDMTSKFKVDLLLLDLNMPVMDGWKVFEQVSTQYPSLPIILVTARPNQFFPALASGAGALMEKPLDFTQLFLTIHNMLEEPVAIRLARALGQSEAFNYIPSFAEDRVPAGMY